MVFIYQSDTMQTNTMGKETELTGSWQKGEILVKWNQPTNQPTSTWNNRQVKIPSSRFRHIYTQLWFAGNRQFAGNQKPRHE